MPAGRGLRVNRRRQLGKLFILEKANHLQGWDAKPWIRGSADGRDVDRQATERVSGRTAL